MQGIGSKRKQRSHDTTDGGPATKSKYFPQAPKQSVQIQYDREDCERKHTWNMTDGGIVELYEGFLSKELADALYTESAYPCDSEHMNWNQEILKMFGKNIVAPRKTAFLGAKDGLTYKYSGTRKVSVVWSPLVEQIKARIEQSCGQQFNVVLLNWYENGDSSIGWHSDDESDMPPGSLIASLSVGMPREFCLKHKSCTGRIDKSCIDRYLSVTLQHGDLFVMGGTLQKHWKHQLPKLKEGTPSRPRINFTFRLVQDTALTQ